MRTEQVTVRHRREGVPATIVLRALCGRDEMDVDGVDTRAAVALLDRLSTRAASTVAAALAASDRDALLAALHRQCWGDRITATLTCEACGSLFDLSFELSAVQQALASNHSSWRASGDGEAVHEDGARIAVPTAQQEIDAVSGDPRGASERLAASCGVTPEEIRDASAGLEAVAPIIDLDLRASCAACAHEQLAHFDVQSYVLQRLLNERDALLAEVHVLAASYGWSLEEILSLTRATRRSLTHLTADPRTASARAAHQVRRA